MPNNYYNQNLSSFRQDTNEVSVPYKPSNILASGPFIENNLLLNLNKVADFHMSFPDSISERDKIFTGKLIEAARDHIMIKGENNNTWIVLPLTYLNYVEFREQPLIYRIENSI